jgi:hypothetical protein
MSINTNQKTLQIGSLKFTYEEHYQSPIADRHWYDVYNGTSLENGDKVEQITIMYDFRPLTETDCRKQKSCIEVYFETYDGDLHQDVNSLYCNTHKTN